MQIFAIFSTKKINRNLRNKIRKTYRMITSNVVQFFKCYFIKAVSLYFLLLFLWFTYQNTNYS